jgi:hypothetical protein
MSSEIVTACAAVVALLITASAALPSPSKESTSHTSGCATAYLTVPRRAYPTVARPPSIYEIYDSLKDKTWSWLPSEPCDNTERIAN